MTGKSFFEEDEPLEDIRAAWEQGERGQTAAPSSLGSPVSWPKQGLKLTMIGLRAEESEPIHIAEWAEVQVSR